MHVKGRIYMLPFASDQSYQSSVTNPFLAAKL